MAARSIPKSMTGIFHDIRANRTAQAAATRNATKHFVVVSLTKKGTPSRPDAMTMRYSAIETREQADVRKAELEGMNPGKTFVILPL